MPVFLVSLDMHSVGQLITINLTLKLQTDSISYHSLVKKHQLEETSFVGVHVDFSPLT